MILPRPLLALHQIVFFVWVRLNEHKWVILAERRGELAKLQKHVRLQGRPLQRQSFVEKLRLAVQMPQHAGRSADRQEHQYEERLPMEYTGPSGRDGPATPTAAASIIEMHR